MSNYNEIKQFWTQQIKTLRDRDDMHTTKNQGNYALRPDHSDWESKINALATLQEVNDYALFLAIKIYKKNQKLFSPFGVPYNDLDSLLKWLKIEKEYRQVLLAEIKDYEQELTALKVQLDHYKNTWDGHVCSSSTPCSHTDYDTIKTERDNLKTTNTNLTQEKTNLQTERDHLKDQLAGKTDFDKIKQDIAKQIITDSGLDLTPDSKLEQLITKIKDLIKQPDNQERERENNYWLANPNQEPWKNHCGFKKA